MRLLSLSFFGFTLASCLAFAAGCAVDAAPGDGDPAGQDTSATTSPSASAAPAESAAPAPSSVATNPDDANPATVCVQRVYCRTGDHFDRTVCACVPDPSIPPSGGPTTSPGTRGGPVKHGGPITHGLACTDDTQCEPLVCDCIGGHQRELPRYCSSGTCDTQGATCEDVCLRFPR